MLSILYEYIGDKIKKMAGWIFVIEALCAIIVGIVLMCINANFTLIGILIMIVGPLLAFVSTWILYAFGQIVEDIHTMCQIKSFEAAEERVNSLPSTGRRGAQKATLGKATQCDCGELHYGWYCPVCGKKTEAKSAPRSTVVNYTQPQSGSGQNNSHICKCGERFYGDKCPICERTLKDL